MEGFSDAWGAWETYWHLPTPENREACRDSLSPETIRDFQYLQGADASLVLPDGYTLDIAYMSRPEFVQMCSLILFQFPYLFRWNQYLIW